MANVFIYAGLCIMLLGALYGIYVAITGMRDRNEDRLKKQNMFGVHFGFMTPKMKKLMTVWGIIMVLGFIITGIGIAIGLK